MKTINRVVVPSALILCWAGCNAAEPVVVPNGSEDTGLFVPDIDLPAEGEPAVPLAPGECMQNPLQGAFGYWHQCYGEIQLDFIATYNGKQYVGNDILHFGPGAVNSKYWIDPDRYDLPLVAACCGPFDYPNPTTQEKIPYVNNCLYDMVEQICVGMPHFLRKQAEETPLAEGKLALQWLAGKIEDNPADCLASLWAGGPPGPDGQNVNELSGTSWAPPGTPALITISSSNVYDWTEFGEVPELTPCESIFDNDTAVIPTAPFSVPGVVGGSGLLLAQDSSASAFGPFLAMATFEIAAARSGLTVATDPSGAPVVTRFTLEAGANVVSVDGTRGVIEHARLTLASPLRPEWVGGEYVVAVGQASFTAAIGFGGDNRVVTMRNADPLVLHEDAGTWQVDPFELVYDDVGIGEWSLLVDGLDFVQTRG